MAATEHVAIVEARRRDAQAGLALSTEARWNQIEADWRYFLSNGVVFSVRDVAHLVATAALLPYSSGNAWISMVLVTASFAAAALRPGSSMHASRRRARHGLTSWLDATPDGAAVYGPLGFTPTLQLRRLRLAKSAPCPATRAASSPRTSMRSSRAIGAPSASTAPRC